MTTVSLVVAMAHNRVIGIKNRLPWKLPADLRHFRQLTMGKPVIMGRLTYESIGKPLDGRTNIVITRDRNYRAAGCHVLHSIDDALDDVADTAEAMIIGGARLYEQILPRADRIHLTLIHHDFVGDTFFPAYDESAWQIIQRVDMEPDVRNRYRYSFLTLERIRSSFAR